MGNTPKQYESDIKVVFAADTHSRDYTSNGISLFFSAWAGQIWYSAFSGKRFYPCIQCYTYRVRREYFSKNSIPILRYWIRIIVGNTLFYPVIRDETPDNSFLCEFEKSNLRRGGVVSADSGFFYSKYYI